MFPAFNILRLAVLMTLAACLAADQDSTFTELKKTEAKVITEVEYMPPMIIIGDNNGKIVRCPHATPNNCEVYHSGNSSVTATLVHGEYLFASLKSGAILRCLWLKRQSCYEFNNVGTEINGLAVATGHLYAGLHNGTILRCSLDSPHSCRIFAEVNRQLFSLTIYDPFIYAGSDDGRVFRCSLTSAENCSQVYHAVGSDITGLVYLSGRLYGIRTGGVIQYCTDVCNEYGIPGSGYKDMALYNKRLYAAQEGVGIRVNDPVSERVDIFVKNIFVRSVSFTYGTFIMQKKFKEESRECIWKGVFTCPPTVVYYDVGRRLMWEVSVKDGKLYDSQGVLLDTSDADESYSRKAAIFVMGPDGQILMSKIHKTGFLHTSSLLAGNPVSGAGLMVVEQGKIRNITACSVHYRPDPDLNKQVQESLFLKGYTDSFDSYPCTYKTVFCANDATDGRSSPILRPFSQLSSSK